MITNEGHQINSAAIEPMEEMALALESISNFAWTALHADCVEARDEINKRVNACRAALSRYEASK